MTLMECPDSGLMLPSEFIDQRKALTKFIDELLEKARNDLSHVRENYFLTFHAKFNDAGEFRVDLPEATTKIPGFTSNQIVYWVSNKLGICELLWMVSPTTKGEKLKVEFNKTGVAYLQAKGAMPS